MSAAPEFAQAEILEPSRLQRGPTTLIKAKTRRGKRILEKRGPKLIEDAKRALVLYGNKTSQLVKDVLGDLHKLKGLDAQKYSRKNEDIRPIETGGEGSLEFYCQKGNCSLFALGTHSKKRPHNLTLGRMYDFHLYDCLELGIQNFKPLKEFAAGSNCQQGNKPCILFVGDKFETVPALKQAKSLLLDFFRGLEVRAINLAGLDRVMLMVALDDNKILMRQYNLKYKKSGNKVPKASLTEMGPQLDLTIRRSRLPPVDLEKEAMKKPKLTKKKEKNVGSDLLAGKVGRIYMPKQTVDSIGLAKMKGLKRERRASAAAASNSKDVAATPGSKRPRVTGDD